MKILWAIVLLALACGRVEAQGCLSPKSERAVFVIPREAGKALVSGDLVTARYGSRCVGSGVFRAGRAFYLTIWGDDFLTETVDGIPEGAPVQISVIRPATGEVYRADVSYGGQNRQFEDGGIMVVRNLVLTPTIGIEVQRGGDDVHIEADADRSAAFLTWEAPKEALRAGFVVEHAAPSDTTFTAVAFVEGQGTAAEAHRYRRRVEDLAPGTHRFRLKQVDFDGSFAYSPEVEVEIALPEAFVLGEAYPNPFNPVTRLNLSVRETERVEVSVYDVTGRRVEVLHRGAVQAGQTQELVFDGAGLGSGLYFIRARGESFEATRQVMLVK